MPELASQGREQEPRPGATGPGAVRASAMRADELANHVILAAAGDSTAAERVIAAVQPLILFALLRRGLQPADAEGITNEVLYHYWRKRRSLHDPSRLFGWLRTVVDRKRKSHWRKEMRWRRLDALEADVSEPLLTAGLVSRRTAEEILKSLSPPAADLLRAQYLDGLTHPEIAARFHLGVGQVAGLIHRGREILRRKYISRNPLCLD